MAVPCVRMLVTLMQQPGGSQVDQQADDGDDDCLVEADLRRRPEARQRLADHRQRDHHQQQRTGETGQHLDFPGAECEALVPRVAPGQQIGECGQAYRDHVRGHVPTIGEQGHRVEQVAGRHLHQHGHAGQRSDQPGLTLGALLERPIVMVRVPIGMITRAHVTSSICATSLRLAPGARSTAINGCDSWRRIGVHA